jgi:hypothetical protein
VPILNKLVGTDRFFSCVSDLETVNQWDETFSARYTVPVLAIPFLAVCSICLSNSVCSVLSNIIWMRVFAVAL